jgi:hypothetical protein
MTSILTQRDASAGQRGRALVPAPRASTTDAPATVMKMGDSDAAATWRKRMGMPDAKILYKDRAATAECVNALARERGLTRLRVRGPIKARCVLLLHALAHNLMRTLALAPELLGLGTALPEASAQAV